MNIMKRIFGFVWLLLAFAAAYFSIFIFGLPKLTTGRQEDLVFGIIILFVLSPLIFIGLGAFGYYAIRGEYDQSKL